jgi:hypothetical protein
MPEHFKQNGFMTLGGGKTFHPRHPLNWDEPTSWTQGGSFSFSFFVYFRGSFASEVCSSPVPLSSAPVACLRPDANHELCRYADDVTPVACLQPDANHELCRYADDVTPVAFLQRCHAWDRMPYLSSGHSLTG